MSCCYDTCFVGSTGRNCCGDHCEPVLFRKTLIQIGMNSRLQIKRHENIIFPGQENALPSLSPARTAWLAELACESARGFGAYQRANRHYPEFRVWRDGFNVQAVIAFLSRVPNMTAIWAWWPSIHRAAFSTLCLRRSRPKMWLFRIRPTLVDWGETTRYRVSVARLISSGTPVRGYSPASQCAQQIRGHAGWPAL